MDRLLFIQARNLGDAVVSTTIINSLGASFPRLEIELLTRPSLTEVFAGNPHIRHVHFANFPWGTVKHFTLGEAFRLVRVIRRLRGQAFDVCLNNFGDWRENLLGRLTAPQQNVSVAFSPGHRFTPIIRPGADFAVNRTIEIPDGVFNVYGIAEYLARAMGCKKIEAAKIFGGSGAQCQKSGLGSIGIHPVASQQSKLWTWSNWKELIDQLVNDGNKIEVFCAPSERSIVESEIPISRWGSCVRVFAMGIREFLDHLPSIEVLIGLDSFSVHAAHALGVRSVLLSGATDTEGWAPPTSAVLSKGTLCPSHPCFNKPKCIGAANEYVCMRAITVDEVYRMVVRRLLEPRLSAYS
jgi:heptosyltransferase-3